MLTHKTLNTHISNLEKLADKAEKEIETLYKKYNEYDDKFNKKRVESDILWTKGYAEGLRRTISILKNL